MNFPLPFFEDAHNFWIVLAAMVVFAIVIVAIAIKRRWV